MSNVSEVSVSDSSAGSIPDCYTDYELFHNGAPISATVICKSGDEVRSGIWLSKRFLNLFSLEVLVRQCSNDENDPKVICVASLIPVTAMVRYSSGDRHLESIYLFHPDCDKFKYNSLFAIKKAFHIRRVEIKGVKNLALVPGATTPPLTVPEVYVIGETETSEPLEESRLDRSEPSERTP
jgi:hypothetical protein